MNENIKHTICFIILIVWPGRKFLDHWLGECYHFTPFLLYTYLKIQIRNTNVKFQDSGKNDMKNRL